MNRKDHPRGLDSEEREEWHVLCDRLLELYEKMPDGDTKRKVIAGGNMYGCVLMFFRGCKEDILKIREMLG